MAPSKEELRAILRDKLGGTVKPVDAGYQGEILVALWNASSTPFTFKHGDRIAQLVVGFTPSPVTVQQVQEFQPSPRGEKGFGSSGR